MVILGTQSIYSDLSLAKYLNEVHICIKKSLKNFIDANMTSKIKLILTLTFISSKDTGKVSNIYLISQNIIPVPGSNTYDLTNDLNVTLILFFQNIKIICFKRWKVVVLFWIISIQHFMVFINFP